MTTDASNKDGHYGPCNACHGARMVWDHAVSGWGARCSLCEGQGVQHFPSLATAVAELRAMGLDFAELEPEEDDPVPVAKGGEVRRFAGSVAGLYQCEVFVTAGDYEAVVKRRDEAVEEMEESDRMFKLARWYQAKAETERDELVNDIVSERKDSCELARALLAMAKERDELVGELAKARGECARMRAALNIVAHYNCSDDGLCPSHGRCASCTAREALEPLPPAPEAAP